MLTKTLLKYASIMLFLTLNNAIAQQASNNIPELVILSWSEYMDPEIIAKFEKTYNVKVREVYYESDDTRDDMLVESDGTEYDLVVSSGSSLRTYLKRDWLTPFTKKQVPNLIHIKNKWVNAFEGSAGYSIPYFWGTLGIAYRSDLVSTPITSWKQIFEPKAELHNKILMANSVNDVIGVALKSLGFSSNSFNKDEYKLAEKLLTRQKAYVKDYAYLALNEDSSIVKGDIYVSMAYSGDALTLIDIEPKIKYIVPVEGGGIWVDYFTVMNKSKKKDLSFKFLNFINKPAHAAQIAEYVYYASPNSAAEKILPKEFTSDPSIYPKNETLLKSEFNQPIPPRIKRYRNNIFNNLKTINH